MSAKAAKMPMSNKKFTAIWGTVLALVLVIAVVANVALSVFGKLVETQLGTGSYSVENVSAAKNWDLEYDKADYDSLDQAKDASSELVENIASEGIVLLKNEANSLPLSGKNVTMLGRDAADPIYGGSGSGSVDASTAVNARSGLENAGFSVNKTVYKKLENFAAKNERGSVFMDNPKKSTYQIGEMPAKQYDSVTDTFADYNDAALVFIGRPGGEGGDLTTDMKGWDDNYTKGQHQLELNQDEKDTVALAEKNFDTVVVIINSSAPMELGELQNDSNVDAILQVGSPGQNGFNALGKILDGEVNPSGHLADIYPADFTADPTFVNFGDYTYSNISGLKSDPQESTSDGNGHFVDYAEGIYVGYRYYETAAVENFIDYDKAVVYPFGYGLSYTDFSWEMVDQSLPSDTTGDISLKVKVTNDGDTAGKDVVQVYYSAPYTKGGIEKSAVVLGAFAKTKLLQPGESQTLTLSFAAEDMASYDYQNAGAYVLEKGDYNITVQTDSHHVKAGIAPLTYTVDKTVIYGKDNPRQSDKVAAVNQFDDVSAMFSDTPEQGKITNFSRADFAGTFPTAPDKSLTTANDKVVAGFKDYDANAAAAASDATMPTTGADNGVSLSDLRGLDYNDPQWDKLLDELTVSEMTEMLLNGAYNTGGINSIVKPASVDLDGPAGLSSFMNSKYNGTAFPSEVLIAQTWNVDLAHDMGLAVGNEALTMGVNSWYAPAVNTHRSPFEGRTFEYYSEDGLLAGKLAAAVISGAGEKGVPTFVKHFALNEQETNRSSGGVATWANEQAIREIYLKPFQIALQESSMTVSYLTGDDGALKTTTIGASAVMSSFNRIGTTWAGGSTALQTNVLRDEWGFTGMVISDFNLYHHMSPDQGIAAGTDLTLTFAPMKSYADDSSAYAVTNLRHATHDVLYTVANSNAMNGIAPGATMSYTPPTWRYIQIAVDVVLVLLLAGGVYLIRRRRQRVSALVVSSLETDSLTADAVDSNADEAE